MAPRVPVDCGNEITPMIRVTFTLLGIVCIPAFTQQAQGPLTDQRIVDLALAGVSQREIIRIVSSAPEVTFVLSPLQEQAMMNAGVTEDIIKAMAARESGSADHVSASFSEHTGTATQRNGDSRGFATALPADVGVYYEQSGDWVEMMPELVNWKTGGVVKSISTIGIVKHDVNGRIRGGKSGTALAGPIQLLVYCPEGTQITEYQLIRLRMHSSAREFRTVTGGVFHVSGDSNRDDLPFNSKHLAARTYIIALTGLKPGEYGLLPPGAVEARSASAQLGKMYTFTVVE